jgi:hypothetical protein
MDRENEPGKAQANQSNPALVASDDVSSPVSIDKVERTVTNNSENQVYSIHSRKKRMLLCSLASAAGFLSPFTANIYFPALNNIQKVGPSISG